MSGNPPKHHPSRRIGKYNTKDREDKEDREDAFGDMGQTARLHIIRDRFVAGHDSCELRQHLDSVPPETPIQNIVDRCRVWENHADSDVRRISKPGPDLAFPTYVVSDSERGTDDRRVDAVTTSQSTSDQLETLLRRLLAGPDVPAPPPKPEPPTVEVVTTLANGDSGSKAL